MPYELPRSLIPSPPASKPVRSARAAHPRPLPASLEVVAEDDVAPSPAAAEEVVAEDDVAPSPAAAEEEEERAVAAPSPAAAEEEEERAVAAPSPAAAEERAVVAAEDVVASSPPPVSSEEAVAEADVVVIEEDLERTKTLKQLRDMCAAAGLPNHGRKGELVARLRSFETAGGAAK
jgi:hypothetical protein